MNLRLVLLFSSLILSAQLKAKKDPDNRTLMTLNDDFEIITGQNAMSFEATLILLQKAGPLLISQRLLSVVFTPERVSQKSVNSQKHAFFQTELLRTFDSTEWLAYGIGSYALLLPKAYLEKINVYNFGNDPSQNRINELALGFRLSAKDPNDDFFQIETDTSDSLVKYFQQRYCAHYESVRQLLGPQAGFKENPYCSSQEQIANEAAHRNEATKYNQILPGKNLLDVLDRLVFRKTDYIGLKNELPPRISFYFLGHGDYENSLAGISIRRDEDKREYQSDFQKLLIRLSKSNINRLIYTSCFGAAQNADQIYGSPNFKTPGGFLTLPFDIITQAIADANVLSSGFDRATHNIKHNNYLGFVEAMDSIEIKSNQEVLIDGLETILDFGAQDPANQPQLRPAHTASWLPLTKRSQPTLVTITKNMAKTRGEKPLFIDSQKRSIILSTFEIPFPIVIGKTGAIESLAQFVSSSSGVAVHRLREVEVINALASFEGFKEDVFKHLFASVGYVPEKILWVENFIFGKSKYRDVIIDTGADVEFPGIYLQPDGTNDLIFYGFKRPEKRPDQIERAEYDRLLKAAAYYNQNFRNEILKDLNVSFVPDPAQTKKSVLDLVNRELLQKQESLLGESKGSIPGFWRDELYQAVSQGHPGANIDAAKLLERGFINPQVTDAKGQSLFDAALANKNIALAYSVLREIGSSRMNGLEQIDFLSRVDSFLKLAELEKVPVDSDLIDHIEKTFRTILWFKSKIVTKLSPVILSLAQHDALQKILSDHVKSLDLQAVEQEKIVVAGFAKLKTLSIRESSVETIEISGLLSLEKLELTELESLQHLKLEGLQNLEDLNLVGNELSSLQTLHVQNLSALYQLNLTELPELQRIELKDLKKLESLYVDKLPMFSELILVNLPMIKTIYLNDTTITDENISGLLEIKNSNPDFEISRDL